MIAGKGLFDTELINIFQCDENIDRIMGESIDEDEFYNLLEFSGLFKSRNLGRDTKHKC